MCSRASLRGRDGIALVQGCELLRFDVERALELPNWCTKHADRVTFLLLGEVPLGKGLESVLCDRKGVDES